MYLMDGSICRHGAYGAVLLKTVFATETDMYSANFIFDTKQFDAEFHRLDALIA